MFAKLEEAETGSSPATGPSNRRTPSLPWLLAFAAVVVGLGVMPNVYGLLVFGPAYPSQFHGAFATHVMLNCLANTAVMIGALRLRDRLDRKLAGVLSRLLLVHGTLGFLLLVTRQFHSNQVMLTAAMASAVLGSLFMYLEHRGTHIRAAIVGPWHPLVAKLNMRCEHVTDPAADLRRYDLLLTPNMIDLAPGWSSALSRAMLAGIPVRHLAEFVEEDQGIVSIEHFDLDHLPLSGLTSYRTRKRLMDVFLVLASAPIALPLCCLGALLVVITMGRPAIFVQDRTGLAGKVFRMYKLRTMREPGGSNLGKATIVGDVRVTPVGRWLRRFRIDELPQLWNVLKGDMSIIGPRPEWTLLSEEYSRSLPVYGYRHLVRPGITGWAQVRGGYASDLAETRTKVGYDLFYIKNLSFSMDVQILLRTVWTLLTGSGAR